jgi:hypothetical protein
MHRHLDHDLGDVGDRTGWTSNGGTLATCPRRVHPTTIPAGILSR